MKRHKDGIARDVEKLWDEGVDLADCMRPYWGDWLRAPWNMHHFTDLFVESARISPYFVGHMWAAYLPLSLATIWWLW